MTQRLKIFLSWAGDTSKAIAIALNEWLPLVLQNVEPWFSPDDIDKGGQWATALSDILESGRVGIICLTPENLTIPWIHFEAGALWKAVTTSRVCPFLFNIPFATDVKPPLGMFQSTRATEKEEVRRLIKTLNSLLAEIGSDLPEARVDKAFDKWWPDLEARLAEIGRATPAAEKPLRDVAEMVSELLEHVRALSRRFDSLGATESAAAKLSKPEPALGVPDAPKDPGPASSDEPEEAPLGTMNEEG